METEVNEMNTQHTSGPWWIGHGTLSIYSSEGRIADLKQSANDDQDEADARLIAAAPDLLEALKEYEKFVATRRSELGTLSNEMERVNATVRAAINKATGY